MSNPPVLLLAARQEAPRVHLQALALVLALSLALIVPVGGTAMAQDAGPTPLTSDGSAAGNAAAWSEITFAAGAASTVLIARDDQFADALASGPVQHLLGAPLLLTGTDEIPPATAQELARLAPDRAVILGGDLAVSEAVRASLEGMGMTTERVAGATRVHTAVEVQRRFFPNATDVVLTRAFGGGEETQAFADTIALGAYGAITAMPILLTATDQLSEPTASGLSESAIEQVVIVGGTGAVSEAVAEQVDAIDNEGADEDPGITVRRVSGDTRFATAVALATDVGYATAADTRRVLLVEGQAADAWTGGLPAAAQAGNDAPVVLANGDLLLAPTFDFLFGAGVGLICGPGVSPVACDKAAAALAGEGTADEGGSSEGGGRLDVSPAEDREATLSEPDPLGGLLVPEDDSDDLVYTVAGLDPEQAYRVTLVLSDNVTVDEDGAATFVDADEDGIADPGASEEVALITFVNGAPEEVNGGDGTKTVPTADDDPAAPSGVFPDASGVLTVTVDGVGGGSVRPVAYVNGGTSTLLEIDAEGAPVEAYGVGGQAIYS